MSKLIEKEGKFYKECGVVMLERPATKSNLIINKRYEKSYINSVVDGYKSYGDEYIHLYITSDDEIKEGDWYLEPNVDIKPTQCKKISELTKDDKKIIATTDPLLDPCCDDGLPKICNCNLGLPQPSDKFIQAYIDAYNKGEKIEKVLVEYGLFCNTNKYPNIKTECNCPCTEEINCGITLKLKDNNIIIKKTKDSWSREEVETSHLSMAVDIAKHILQGNSFTTFNPEEWIKQNL